MPLPYNRYPIYALSSVTGLTEWVDYIPVQQESSGRAESYDVAGYLVSNEVLSSTTGKTAWVDYIPVYVVTGRSTPWYVGASGYIPYFEAGGILSNFVVTPAEGGSTASISVNVNSDEGTVYFVVVPSGSAVPTEAQIKAGTDGDDTAAAWDGSAAVTAIDTYIVGPTDLIQDTDYVAYAVHEDLTPEFSNIVTRAFTTTDEVPVLTSPTDAANGDTGATLGVTTDDPNGTIYWVVTTSATTPSHAQIVAGQDHTGTAAADSGSLAVTSAGAKSGISATGLTASTAYYAHFTQVDAATNAATPVSADGFTTGTGLTIDYSAGVDGTVGDLGINSGTLVTAQPDSDGGNDAIRADANAGVTSCFPRFVCTLYVGVNYISFKVKKGNWPAATEAWLRIRTISMTTGYLQSISIDDGTIGGSGGFTNVATSDLGSGWYLVTMECDTTGFADTAGTLNFYFGEADNGQVITADQGHQVYFHDVIVGH